MPLYQFHSGAHEPRRDSTAIDLPDVDAAGREAIRRLAELLASDPSALWREDIASVVVANESGLTLFSVDASVSRAPALAGLRGPQAQ